MRIIVRAWMGMVILGTATQALAGGAGDRKAMVQALGQSSLMFVENMGQFDERARFRVAGGGRTAWLTEDGLWLQISDRGPEGRELNLKLEFADGRRAARVEPFGRLETTVSFFLGNDPAQWRSAVPVWTGVRYREVYDGVDLEITGSGGKMEWRWVATREQGVELPPVDAFRVVGSEEVIASEATLEVRTALGPVILKRPRLMDAQGGAPGKGAARREASSGSEREAGTVDLLYSSYLGGSQKEFGTDIAVDSAGAAYITGFTDSSNFPVTAGVLQGTRLSSRDAFVAKMNAAGTAFSYVTFLGGDGDDLGAGIAVDANGAAYVTGQTASDTFPTLFGAHRRTRAGSNDAFIVKLNSSGSSLLAATLFGGSGSDTPSDISLVSSSLLAICGETTSNNLPAFNSSYRGARDGFLATLATDGTAVGRVRYVGSDALDTISAMAVGGGYIWVTGITDGPVFGTVRPGGRDGFVARYTQDLATFGQAVYIGGSGDDQGHDIAVDSAENVVVVGTTRSSDFPVTAGVYQQVYFGASAFVTKLDGLHLGTFRFSTFLFGPWTDTTVHVALDDLSNVYVGGSTFSTTFPVTADAYRSTYDCCGVDSFITVFTNNGAGLSYSSYFGGGGHDQIRALAKGPGGLYLTGFTESDDFPVTAGAPQATRGGVEDAFVAKLALPNKGTVRGIVWFDGDRDGNKDSVEILIEGITVFHDANGDGALSTGERRVTSRSDIGYIMSGLDWGTARICVVIPSGGSATTSRCRTVTVQAGAVVTGINFGVYATVIGTFNLSPSAATVAHGERISYGVTWTVPEGRVWRDLSTVQIRFVDNANEETVLWLRFEEASGTFSVFNTATEEFGPAFTPGRPNRLETRWATLYLDESAVIGSGPTGRVVTMRFDMSVKPPGAGRTYSIYLLSTDDFGNVQGWEPAGTLAVSQ